MEAALALATLVALAVLCAAGLTAAAMQIGCIDAARETARLAARGDVAAVTGAQRLAPAGMSVEVRRDGVYVRVRVSGRVPLLPGLVIAGEAVAMVEPGR